MRIFFAAFTALVALAFSGCGTPPESRLEAPVVRVTAFTAVNGGHVLALRIINPNATPLVVNSSTHQLSLGDKRLPRVDDPQPIGVPSLGSVEHSVALSAKASAEASAWLAQHPGQVQVTVESAFEVIVGSDNDTITLRSLGRGVVKPTSPGTVTIQ